jgi:hypothetical protein
MMVVQKKFKALIIREMIVKIINFIINQRLVTQNLIRLMIKYSILLLSNLRIMNNCTVILRKNLEICNKIKMLINHYSIHQDQMNKLISFLHHRKVNKL